MPVSAPVSERLALVDVTRELRALCGQPVDYNAVWKLVARGAVPAQRIRGRWHLSRGDLPQVVEALGLACRPTAA